jgi:hypothetical protein
MSEADRLLLALVLDLSAEEFNEKVRDMSQRDAMRRLLGRECGA